MEEQPDACNFIAEEFYVESEPSWRVVIAGVNLCAKQVQAVFHFRICLIFLLDCYHLESNPHWYVGSIQRK